MESLQSVWGALLLGNFAISLDLQDAYFHVPMRPTFRKFLQLSLAGRVYQFKTLPFGLSTAPWLFTE